MTKKAMKQALDTRKDELKYKLFRVEEILNNFPSIDTELAWRSEHNEIKGQLRELDYIYLVIFEL